MDLHQERRLVLWWLQHTHKTPKIPQKEINKMPHMCAHAHILHILPIPSYTVMFLLETKE
jgi:hypothetical protein